MNEIFSDEMILEKFAEGDSVRTIFFALRDGGRKPIEYDRNGRTTACYCPTQTIEAVIRKRLAVSEKCADALLGSVIKEQQAAIKAIPKGGEWTPEKQMQIEDLISGQIEKNQAMADWVVEQCRDELDDYKVPLAHRQWLAWKWFFGIPGDD